MVTDIPNLVTKQEVNDARNRMDGNVRYGDLYREFIDSIQESTKELMDTIGPLALPPAVYLSYGIEIGMTIAYNRCLNAISQCGESFSSQTLDNDTESVVS